MGGGSSSPRIVYRSDPAVAQAAQAAAAAAERAAQQNEAMQRRMEQLEQQNAQNQRAMIDAVNNMAEASARDNTAEIEAMRREQERQMEEMNARRNAMEEKFAREMAEAKEENRAELARQHASHRAEQERLEAEARANRLAELMKQRTLIEESLQTLEQETGHVQQQLDVEERKLDDVNCLLIAELQARAQFESPDLDPHSLKLVLLGNTGDGKSTLGNRITGDDSKRGDRGVFATSGGIESATQVIKTAFTRHEGQSICICDTPGGGDSGHKDRIHATNLVQFLRGIGSVTAFVLVRNRTNKRLSDGDQAILGSLEQILGRSFWRNVMIVFTRVDDEEEMEELEDEKRILPNHLRKIFNLDHDVADAIKVAGCGKRNFREQVPVIFEAAMQCNGGVGFVCDELIAPVEDRQIEKDAQQAVVNELRLRFQGLVQRKGSLEAQLEQVTDFIRDMSA